jgi:hypothetical protein
MKFDRLVVLVGLRQQWSREVSEVRRMHGWLLHAEHLLSGEWRVPDEMLPNAKVAQCFDSWCAQLAQLVATEPLSENEQRCLAHFLKTTEGLRPHLILCYDREEFPRTTNAMEGIHSLPQNPLPPHQRTQKLEQLSVALRTMHRLLRLLRA